MAKALFHKAQRVFVKPVGTWVRVERIVPHWVKGVDEPLRISYDCGLGRLFQGHELVSEQAMQDHAPEADEDDDLLLEHWRVVRRMIRWRADDMPGAPSANPGTYPVIATDDGSTGGWRVPSTEYDRDPQRVEHQARIIVHAPDLLRIARKLTDHASAYPERMDEEMLALVRRCSAILRDVYRLEYEPAEAAE
ncbi:hypothetical protein [Hyphomonas sp.]|uniref:hypothetical protein n=1 Tax=Hyphomonas sp. TaxID=87 RepID=UPI003918B4C7